MPETETTFSAWNPGLEPEIPRAYLTLETIHRPENVTTALADVSELSTLTGLNAEELVAFRPERLMLHELIVRITADIVVQEGESEEALGLHFREIVHTIMDTYLQPRLTEIERDFTQLSDQVQQVVHTQLATTLFAPTKPESDNKSSQKRFPFNWFRSRKPTPPAETESIQEKHYRLISGFKDQGLAAEDPLQQAVFKSLYRVLGSIASTHGYVITDQTLLEQLVTRHVCNNYGSRLIRRAISSSIDEAIQQQGYSRLPCAEKPILLSLKGASAAGKSTSRPMLKTIMGEKGIQPDNYGTISPDIWRRLLLDYESLGEAYKYAGRLTSNEVNIVDNKLDRYIRDKANRDHAIPNLLVDRFRFDSFSTEKVSQILHGTYASYVDTLYMYFIVTPPEATVERGWERGLVRGRYKAVEDFLGHSVEAYVGMPKLFFKWMAYRQPLFKYVFLDNSVPKGTTPKTIAEGTQQAMDIYNPIAFIDIERYQKINIKAKCPEDVYPPAPILAIERNSGFLRQCIKQLPVVNFIDEVSSKTYLRSEGGVFEIVDGEIMQSRLAEQPELAELFKLIAPEVASCTCRLG